ncbi:MAG TPA: hypothetical protein ENG70_01340 [Candidatus Cloacimonetes bacterium]|nr:hypothetical protein [Candidatus Cloacimonadota bacterium]HEX37493.1 hypothetical protein [Candidatus Cloacimonadota bacterium]
MKKLVFLILLAVLFVSLLFAEANPAAVILQSKGVIELSRDGEKKNVSSGEILYNGDELVSSEESIAAIRFVDDGAIIKLFSNSILTIITTKVENKLDKQLYLEVGELWSKVKKESGAYQIETPTAVAAVKGTDFLTEVKDNGDTWLFTFEGVVELKTDVGSVEVSKGSTGIAVSGSAPIQRKTEKDEIKEGVRKEIEQVVETNVMEIEFKDANGETKTMKIYYK